MRSGLLIAVSIGVAGCREEPQEFVPPPPEPREVWTSATGEVSFSSPGKGWRLWTEAEMAAFGHEVRLGVEGPRGCSGWVAVRDGYDDGSRVGADAARAEVTLDGLEVHVDEDVKYDLWTARRWEVQGRREGVMHSIRSTFFVNLKRLWRLEAEAVGRDYVDRRRCLDTVTAGFVFNLPREPKP